MKKLLMVIIVLVISIGAIITMAALPWLCIATGVFFLPSIPQPEIKHGEFPFELIYEINGVKKVVKDTIICDYDGIGMDEGRGKYRKWKLTYASGNECISLLKQCDTELYYEAGNPEDFMESNGHDEYILKLTTDAGYMQIDGPNKGNMEYGVIEESELLKKYHIRLVYWHCANPIKNSFK